MGKRQTLEADIALKKKKIAALQSEIVELRIQTYLLTDKEQRFEEKMETLGRGKTKREQLVGRIHFNEDFKDESTNEVITIERSRVVRVDGEWLIKNYEL